MQLAERAYVDIGDEIFNNQKNCGEISSGELRCSGMRNPTRVDISTTCYLGYGGGVFSRVEKMIRETFLLRLFSGKSSPLSPVVRALSIMPVNKSGLGILNPVTSVKDKYLSFQLASMELIR